MAIQGIEAVLQKLQATAVQARKSGEHASTQGIIFASKLKAAIGKISDTEQAARQQAQDFSLNDVMVDLQKSAVSLQLGVQVRNKLVAAYQDIMNMPV